MLVKSVFFLDQLIKCSDDYELKIRDIRKEYEKQLNELRSKLLDVTNQVC